MRSRFLAPWAITIGPDGNLWFTNLAINGLGRIEIAATVS
jgi:streptogramin lyase